MARFTKVATPLLLIMSVSPALADEGASGLYVPGNFGFGAGVTPDLRLVHPEGDAPGERRALERLVDLMLVQAVAELVHRGEEPVEVVREVARRDPDVVDARSGGERMDGRVEPPGVLAEAELPQHLELELVLQSERERALRRPLRVAPGGDLLDEGRLVLLQVCEEAPDGRPSSSRGS